MKRMLTVITLAACLALSLAALLGACDKQGGDIAGTWVDEAGVMEFQFAADGTLTVKYPGQKLTAAYAVANGRLSIDAKGPNGSALSAMFDDIEYTVDGDKLTLTNSAGETQTLSRK